MVLWIGTEFFVVTILMTTLSCSVFSFCLAQERAIEMSLLDCNQSICCTWYELWILLCLPLLLCPCDFIHCSAVSDMSRKIVFFLRIPLLASSTEYVRSHSWPSCWALSQNGKKSRSYIKSYLFTAIFLKKHSTSLHEIHQFSNISRKLKKKSVGKVALFWNLSI